jgi:hypothetical protein
MSTGTFLCDMEGAYHAVPREAHRMRQKCHLIDNMMCLTGSSIGEGRTRFGGICSHAKAEPLSCFPSDEMQIEWPIAFWRDVI